MILQKRINKLEELYEEKRNKSHLLVVAYIENEINKMEVFSSSVDYGGPLFSGDIPSGQDFLRTIGYQNLIEVYGSVEWAI